jgi:hypothetical protein
LLKRTANLREEQNMARLSFSIIGTLIATGLVACSLDVEDASDTNDAGMDAVTTDAEAPSAAAPGGTDDADGPLAEVGSLEDTGSEPIASLEQGYSAQTAFSSARHGFAFRNQFTNTLFLDVTTSGLCGGMVYTALDYYHAGRTVPAQNWPPTLGTPLRSQLRNRIEDSIESNLDKWAEVGFNPFGVRNDEFWRWGFQSNARVPELRRAIDAGKPAPLGLQACSECDPGNHQVLAIGYDTGTYSSTWQGYPNLKIRVYDPNYPGETLTLRTDTTSRRWYYESRPTRRWLTYFVDANYGRVSPPQHTSVSNGVVLKLRTGGDDLRGGNDNVNVVLTLSDGRTFRFDRVNNGQRWMGGSTEWVALSLPSTVNPSSVTRVRLETTFGGGIGGDNWNLDELRMYEVRGSKYGAQLVERTGSPVKRFTGDSKTYTVVL